MIQLSHLYREHRFSFVAASAAIMLLVIMLLPLLEIGSRPILGHGISGSLNSRQARHPLVRHSWEPYLLLKAKAAYFPGCFLLINGTRLRSWPMSLPIRWQ